MIVTLHRHLSSGPERAGLSLTLALRGPRQRLLPDVEQVARDFAQDGVIGRVVKIVSVLKIGVYGR